jgi:hypothetical protein
MCRVAFTVISTLDQCFEQSGIEKCQEQTHMLGSFSPLASFQVSAKMAWRLPSYLRKVRLNELLLE